VDLGASLARCLDEGERGGGGIDHRRISDHVAVRQTRPQRSEIEPDLLGSDCAHLQARCAHLEGSPAHCPRLRRAPRDYQLRHFAKLEVHLASRQRTLDLQRALHDPDDVGLGLVQQQSHVVARGLAGLRSTLEERHTNARRASSYAMVAPAMAPPTTPISSPAIS